MHALPAEPDMVLQYLISIGLTSAEGEFRNALVLAQGDEGVPDIRHFVIATVGVAMGRLGFGWPVVMKCILDLRKRTDDQLAQHDAVAVINGEHLITPANTERGIYVYDINTMKELASLGKELTPLITNSVSTAAAWQLVARVWR